MSIFSVIRTERMKDYNDDDNKSIVIRAKTRNKVCTKRRRFAQKKNTYLLKDLTLCADRHCTKTGTPNILGLIFFLWRELLILSVWSLGAEEQEAQVTEPKPMSLFHADQASILQHDPAKSTAPFWWVSSLLNSSPLGRGQIWFLVLPSRVSHSNFLCVNRYPHPLYIIS